MNFPIRTIAASGGVIVVAGICGFLAGKSTLDSGRGPDGPAGAADVIVTATTIATPTAGRPTIDLEAEDGGAGRMVAALRLTDSVALLAHLRNVLADNSLPPLVAKLYCDALVERLVHLGAAGELTGVGGSDRDAVIATTVRALAKTDMPAAEAMIAELPLGSGREGATAAFLAAVGETDPARGLAWIEANPQARGNAQALFGGWAKVNPRAAAEAATMAEPPYPFAVSSVVSEWVRQDPDAAWDWLVALPPGTRNEARRAYFSRVIWDDPEAALDTLAGDLGTIDSFMAQWIGLRIAPDRESADAAIDRMPPGQTRTQLIGGIAGSLYGNPEVAIDWANSLLPGEREHALERIFSALSYEDPEQALVAADALEGSAKRKAVVEVMATWARKDIDAAFEAAIQQLDPETLSAAIPEMVRYQWFTDDASAGKHFALLDHLDPRLRLTSLRALGESQMGQKMDVTFLSLERFSPAEQQAFAEGAIAKSFHLKPADLDRVVQTLPPETQAKHAQQIVRDSTSHDFAQTAKYISQLPDGVSGGTTRQAMDAVLRDWTYVEPETAIAFTGTLPAGEAKDAATQTLVRQLRTFDLDRATQVMATATTAKVRTTLIEELAGEWARVNPARGRAVLAPLLRSDEERQRAAALLEP